MNNMLLPDGTFKPLGTTIAISDWHYPDLKEVYLTHIVNEYGGTGASLVINGDLADVGAIGHFISYGSIPFYHEYHHVLSLVDWLRKHFVYVVITNGNHEDRVSNTVFKGANKEVMWLMSKPNIAKMWADGLRFDVRGQQIDSIDMPNVFVANENNLEASWWCKIGDCIFAHPKKYRRAKMITRVPEYGEVTQITNTMKAAIEFFTLHKIYFRAIVLGHTHKLGKIVIEHGGDWRDDCLFIEQGACCGSLSYEQGPGMNFGPSQNGYAVIKQSPGRGKTNFTKSIVRKFI